MRKINKLIIHCSYTKADMDIGVSEIRKWHVEERDFDDVGYHIIIRRNGDSEQGRPFEVAGAHAIGHNSDSIGICLVGGMDDEGKETFNFTWSQLQTLKIWIESLSDAFQIPSENILGHNEVSPKPCPTFIVKELLKGM